MIDVNELMSDISKAVAKDCLKRNNNLELALKDWIQKELNDKCIPPIKGKITKGKIKWRGLKIVCTVDGKYISQRNNRISPIFHIIDY